MPTLGYDALQLESSYVPVKMIANSRTPVTDANLLSFATELNGPTLVIGEPGCGKSTLLKKIFRDACSSLSRNTVRNPLPIHLELRDEEWQEVEDLGLVAGSALLESVKRKVESVKAVYRPDYVFESYRASSGVVVFLDGLDEVPSQFLRTACEEIRGLYQTLVSSSLGANAVLVTGRHQLLAVLPSNFSSYLGQTLTIQPFSLSDVYLFLGRWPFPESIAATETERIFEAIRSSASLRDMCSNPLVLAMYVARDQRDMATMTEGRKVRLPDNRTDFYREVVDELLILRREDQSKTRTSGSDLKAQREEVLGQIALEHLLSNEPANSVPWRSALEVTARVLRRSRNPQTEAYLRQLSIDTGLYDEERLGETLRFMHLTICEYVAAKELSERPREAADEVLLAATANTDFTSGHRLYEVAVFATVLLQRAHRRELTRRYAQNARTWPLACRVMSEKHDYDDALLQQMVDHALVAVKKNQLEMQSLELLITALARAEVARRAGAARHARSSADDLVLAIVPETNEDQALLLFQAYLQIDPASAIALMSEIKQFRDMSPGVMARSLQDPTMIRFAVDRAAFARDFNGVSYWCTVLAEAALGYRLVADVLVRMKPEPSLVRWEPAQGLQQAPWGWNVNGPAAGTTLGQALSIATRSVRTFARSAAREVRKVGILAELGAPEVLSDSAYGGVVQEVLNLADRAEVDPTYREAALVFSGKSDYSLWVPVSRPSPGVVLNQAELYFNERRFIPADNILEHRTRIRGRAQTGLVCLISSGTALAYLLMALDDHVLTNSENLIVDKSTGRRQRRESGRVTRPSQVRASENDPPMNPGSKYETLEEQDQ